MGTQTITLTEAHEETLAEHAISPELAAEAGIISIERQEDAPTGIPVADTQLPALLMTQTTRNGETRQFLFGDESTDPSAPVIAVHPTHTDRIGKAKNVWLVEGALSSLALVPFAPDDTIVAGFTGTHGWQEDGTTNMDLYGLAKPEATYTVIFNDSIKRTRTAWDAAEAIEMSLQITGTAGVVNHVVHPAAGTTTFARAIARLPANMRAATVARIIAAGTTKRPLKPAAEKLTATKSAIAPTVDWARGRIVEPARDGDGPGTVFLEAAVRITRTTVLKDDLNDAATNAADAKAPRILHDLEVAIGAGEDQAVYPVEGIPDEDLVNTRKWLRRIPGAAGTAVAKGSGQYSAEQIENAIRTHEQHLVPRSTEYMRTGYRDIEGHGTCYLHTGGAIGARGETHASRAHLEADLASINFADPAQFTPEQCTEAINTSLAMMDELTEPANWIMPWSTGMFTMAGCGVAGMCMLIAEAGTGKTTIVFGLGAHLSPVFGKRNMSTVDGTEASIRSLGYGLNDCFLITDDMRPRKAGTRKHEVQRNAIENLVRRAYAGGAAGETKMTQNDNGSYVRSIPDQNSPALMMAGEKLILDASDGDKSTVERILPTYLPTGESAFRSEDTTVFEGLTQNPAIQRVLPLFVQWVCQKIEQFGTKDAWVKHWSEKHSAYKAGRAGGIISPRIAEVAGMMDTGWEIWTQFLLEGGYITPEKHADMKALATTRIDEAAERHASHELATVGTDAERIIEMLKSTMARRTHYIEDLNTRKLRDGEAKPPKGNGDMNGLFDRHPELLGHYRVTNDGKEFIGFNPAVMLKVLNDSLEFRGAYTTTHALAKVLAGVTKDMNEDKKNMKRIRVRTSNTNTQSVSVIAIPYSYFTETDDDE